MREYLLYMKVGQAQVQTFVTPCFAVDQEFWQEKEGCQLHMIGKSPSLALVFSLREKVNARLREREQKSAPINDAVLADLRRLAVATVREVNALYGREAGERKPLQREWFRWEPQERTLCLHADPLPLQERGGVAKRLVNRSALTDGARRASCHSGKDGGLRELLEGRALLWEEIETLLKGRDLPAAELEATLHRMVLSGMARWMPGIRIAVKKSWWRHRLEMFCERCGSRRQALELTTCHTCGQGCAYCTVCLGMGRSKCCTPYLLVPAKQGRTAFAAAEDRTGIARLHWQGQYSPEQASAAEQARRFVATQRPDLSEFLIWAVCGAGKTELLFPSVAEALAAGGRVLIATPRKDVVLELAPRLQRVFPQARVIAVHGSSREKWEEGDIAIATTHQVMRYYRRFLLVVLDEADAFPYHNNPVLYRAVSRAVQEGGKRLYLSATPPRYLQKRLMTKRRPLRGDAALALSSPTHVLLPGRYHGFALPVPEVRTVQGLHKHLAAGRPIAPLLDMIRRALEAERQVFLFVPRITDVERVLRYAQKLLPAHASRMAGVHAADPMREEKVKAFREKQYAVMVTTTILERGVTIPRSDVVVIGAEAPVFDEASLVQIAGRVGRSADAPAGEVLFLQADRAAAPQAAVRQISRMNRLAEKLRTQAVQA